MQQHNRACRVDDAIQSEDVTADRDAETLPSAGDVVTKIEEARQKYHEERMRAQHRCGKEISVEPYVAQL